MADRKLTFDELMVLADTETVEAGEIIDWTPEWDGHLEDHRQRVLRASADLTA